MIEFDEITHKKKYSHTHTLSSEMVMIFGLGKGVTATHKGLKVGNGNNVIRRVQVKCKCN